MKLTDADQAFSDVNFTKVQDTAGVIKYKHNVYSEEIYFNKNKQTYTAKRSGKKASPLAIGMSLHLAISMKIEELEWVAQ